MKQTAYVVLPLLSLALGCALGCGISQEDLQKELATRDQRDAAARTAYEASVAEKTDALQRTFTEQSEALQTRVTTAAATAKEAGVSATAAATAVDKKWSDDHGEIVQLRTLRTQLESFRKAYGKSLDALKVVLRTNLTALEDEKKFLQDRLDNLDLLITQLNDALRETETAGGD